MFTALLLTTLTAHYVLQNLGEVNSLLFVIVCLFVFMSFLYFVLTCSYSLSSLPRIVMLTAGYNGPCNLIERSN